MGSDHIGILDQGLESVIFGEGNDLEDFADSGEDLEDDVQSDGVDHVFHDHPKHCVGAARDLVVLLARKSLGSLKGKERRLKRLIIKQ